MTDPRSLQLKAATTNKKCRYCGIELRYYVGCGGKDQACLDHIIPKANGGTNNPDNLALCCRSCNSMKGKKSLEEFRYLMAWKNAAGAMPKKEIIIYFRFLGIEIPEPEKKFRFYFEENNVSKTNG